MTFRSYGASFYLSALALSTSTATKSIYLCELATRTHHHGRLLFWGLPLVMLVPAEGIEPTA
jgi:hypothetical protein